MKNTKKRGFTIVELVIVIAVIAILASVLIPTFTKVVQAAKDSKELQEARNAYTEALAEHLPETSCTTKTHTSNGWTVTFTDVGKVDASSISKSGASKTYQVVDGVFGVKSEG